ncbi:uncharacterized protein LOC123722321 [Papilio machaon]|uniref:uncharacterized protein LOC123722321 n=1 Tax=Papilio machaon TaxID=76193 RepID=UPI001E665446|nr:uncharacterized protein LOC123722321 [Papilio machaon]
MTKGCVQGSTCGPILWNMILDELLDLPLPPGCHIQAFADDVPLIVSAKTVDDIEYYTNRALDTVVRWGRSVKLEFGPSKTKMIAFTPQAKKANIEINTHSLTFDKEIKYLGIIIDQKLTFNSHVHFIINKASRIFNKLCMYTRPTWGAHPENIKTIHNQVIVPVITYAAGVWGHTALKRCNKKSLESLQRGFAIRAIKAFRTTSTTAALALAQFMPLDLKILERHQIETSRLNGTSPFLPKDVLMELPTPIRNLLHPAERVTIQFQSLSSQNHINSVCPPSACQIYTDGSKQEDGSVGAAFIAWDPGPNVATPKTFKLHKCCTVFQAELLAILEACKFAHEHKFPLTYILTDSLSSLHAIQNRSNTHPLVTQIHQIIYHHRNTGNIHFAWIKSHAGITGNEAADHLANSAAALSSTPYYAKFSVSHLKHELRQRQRQTWEARYQSAPQGSHTKTLLPTLDSVSNLWAATKVSFQLTQFLTGHGYHKAYLYRFKIVDNETCPCDETTVQTLNHLIKECPRFHSRRLDHEFLCGNLKLPPCTLTEIITKVSAIESFVKFITYIIDNLKLFNSSTNQ